MGWLAAGVLAAGLNASYHNGGLEWAHRVVNRVQDRAEMVLALATGDLNQFVAHAHMTEGRFTEARLARVREENSPCRLSLALAQVQHAIPDAALTVAQFDRMSAREQAQLDRLSARRVRMQNQLSRIEIPAVAFRPVMVKVSSEVQACPRVRVNIPRIVVPHITVPAMPQVHVEMAGAGPV